MTEHEVYIDRQAPATPLARSAGRRTARIVGEGLAAGAIGYATVAVLLAAISAWQGQPPLHLAALIGSALFPGMGIVSLAAYNLVHLFVFLIAGLFMAASAALSERAPQAWYPMVVLVMFAGAHVVAAPIWFDAGVQAELPVWLVALVTVVAALAMGAFLWRRHPGIRAAAHEPDESPA